ncbi:MAG: LuxR C-terminal-related transcriptional regulator [Bacteroidales bacterium]
MGLFLLNIESYFSEDQESELYKVKHLNFLDDLARWACLCSAAFQRASFISGCLDKKVYFLSHSFIEVSGYDKSEILSNPDDFMRKITHPSDVEHIGKAYKELESNFLQGHTKLNVTKYSVRYNLRIRNKSKKWVYLECFSYPIYSINNIVHFCINHATISKEKLTPLFQVYFTEDNKRFIFNEKKGVFYSSKKIQLKEIELQILINTARGLKEHEIARILKVEHNTLKYYKKAILNKLSVKSMPEAIYYALKNKIL